MKNKGLFFASVIGGAVLGTVLTCFMKSAKGAKMRGLAHERIIHELEHLRAHMSGMCNCTENGECSCNMGGMEVMVKSEGEDQNNG